MLIVRQKDRAAIKLIQVKYGAGWYENGALITSYAANGNSNTWNWTVPTKAILAISGCGGGGGGGCASRADPGAGAGGGGGGSGLAVQNLIISVPAGENILLTVGANGSGSAPGEFTQTDGGDTTIEFTSLYPGEFDTINGGSLGNFARFRLLGGQKGGSGWLGEAFGHGGHGGYGYLGVDPPVPPIAAGGVTDGADGTVSQLALHPYTRQASGGGAGGLPGTSGGSSNVHIGYDARSALGGITGDGIGGGGAGGVSIFGPNSNGGSASWSSGGSMTWGYGSGGGGGAGNRNGGWDTGWGADGRPGYLEILCMAAR